MRKMELVAKIPGNSIELDIVVQAEHVIIFCEEYRGVFNLKNHEFKEINEDDLEIDELCDGYEIADIMTLNAGTVAVIQLLHRRFANVTDVLQIREKEVPYKLQEVEPDKIDPSCISVPLADSVAVWRLAELKNIADGHNKGSIKDMFRDILHCMTTCPSLWKLEFHGTQVTFIAHEEPKIVIYEGWYYVFVVLWDCTMEVYRFDI